MIEHLLVRIQSALAVEKEENLHFRLDLLLEVTMRLGS